MSTGVASVSGRGVLGVFDRDIGRGEREQLLHGVAGRKVVVQAYLAAVIASGKPNDADGRIPLSKNALSAIRARRTAGFVVTSESYAMWTRRPFRAIEFQSASATLPPSSLVPRQFHTPRRAMQQSPFDAA